MINVIYILYMTSEIAERNNDDTKRFPKKRNVISSNQALTSLFVQLDNNLPELR